VHVFHISPVPCFVYDILGGHIFLSVGACESMCQMAWGSDRKRVCCGCMQAYEFWRHDFVRSNAQIENLLQNIARFCSPQTGGPPKQGEAGVDAQQTVLR